jgi:hypothetical protein
MIRKNVYTGSDLSENNNHTSCVLILLMTIDVFMDFVGLVPREVSLDLLLYSRG